MISRNVVRSRMAAVTAAMLLVTGMACGRFYHRPEDLESEEPAIVIFTNESLDHADVYAVLAGNSPIRMGTVMAGRSDTLTVPRQAVTYGSINIVARLLARTHVPSTGSIAIRAGDWLDVRLDLNGRYLSAVPARQ